jgi:hypothetical protein
MTTIQIKSGVYLNIAQIVTFAVNTFDKKSPSKRVDYGSQSIIPGEKIGEGLILTITTADGQMHKLTEEYSGAARDVLYSEFGVVLEMK